MHEVRLSLTARSKALWEQMRGVLEMECDGHLDDDQLVEVVARRVLGGDSSPSEKPPRPAHRIVVHKCDECARAWQETRGRWIELPPADLDLAECDAMIVNENQQPVTSAEAKASATDKHHTRAAGTRSEAPERVTTNAARATSDIPEKTRKRVWTRDRGRCCVPGCRATRHIDFHHLLARALGGTHDESNIALLCSGHHKLLHQGILSITGPAPDGLVFMRDGKRLVDPRAGGVVAPIDAPPSTARNRFADVAKHEHAKQALRQLGMSAPAARAALEEASAHMDANAGVAQLVQVAFERSRRQVTESATREAVGDEAMKLATQALIQLGYPSAVATSAVNAARAHVGTGDLTTLIKEALQRTSS